MGYDLAYKNIEELSETTAPAATDLVPVSTPNSSEVKKVQVGNIYGTGGAIVDASGGATVDAEARTAINALLAIARTNGWIAP